MRTTRSSPSSLGKKSAKLIKGAVEIYYPGLPHGLTATHADLVNRDLLAFCQKGKRAARKSAAGLGAAVMLA